MRPSSRNPMDGLSRSEKRAWRAAERRVRREHDTEQLAALIGMAAAGGGVTGVTTGPDEDRPATPAELIIEGRRLRAARVSRRSLAKLKEALAGLAAVPLTAVGRYGPYWVLTFKLATEQLVVLVEQLTLMPDWGGPGPRDLLPAGPPMASLGV